MKKIIVLGPRDKDDYPKDWVRVNTTSRGKGWERDLSPFILGPVKLYSNFVSKTMENAWQYAKVYSEHKDVDGPTKKYWKWAKEGWANPRAIRYPMGKGRAPSYSYWDGDRLNYVNARKLIYVPLYAKAVVETAGFEHLQKLVQKKPIILWDFDGYDHVKLGVSLEQVLNDSRRKMGHAFVLKMLLKGFVGTSGL